jgi:hypothetical protein
MQDSKLGNSICGGGIILPQSPQAPQTRIYLLFKIPKGVESFILKILKGEFILYKDYIGISVLHRSWDYRIIQNSRCYKGEFGVLTYIKETIQMRVTYTLTRIGNYYSMKVILDYLNFI